MITEGSDGWSRGPEGREPWPLAAALALAPAIALWTLPQTLVGLSLAALLRMRGVPTGRYRFGPFLFLVVTGAPRAWYGISLGMVVLSDSPSILTHEFCHLYTGLWLGWLYLPVYGVEYLLFGHDRSPHERLTCHLERRNRWGWRRIGA